MKEDNEIDKLRPYRRFLTKGGALLPHSRLYNLEPIGIRTPYVESLTSYVTRLAMAHCVDVGKLVVSVIAPLINKTSLSVGVYETLRVVNSTGVVAEDWVKAIGDLTLRLNLADLTMLIWRDVFSSKTLMRLTRAWCPLCYREQSKLSRENHDPLLWSLRIVTICVRHQHPLYELCPFCRKKLPAISNRSRPGHCSMCGQWLGHHPDANASQRMRLDRETLKYQTWIVDQVGSMLARVPDLKTPPSREGIIEAVSACIQKVTKGRIGAFVNQHKGINRTSLVVWRNGRVRPELGAIMSLCYQAEIPIKDHLLGEATPSKHTDERIRTKANRSTRSLDSTELAGMKNLLQTMLGEIPPQSMTSASKRLGCDHRTIKKYYPELYDALDQQFRSYKEKLYDKKEILTAMQKAQVEVPSPSLEEVARRLGCSREFLRVNFPEEYHVIVKNYDALRKILKDPDRVEGMLRHLYSLDPPINIKACAILIGCCPNSLRKKFPAFCAEIMVRYNRHRLKTLAEKRKRKRIAVRKTIKVLQAEGLKPTAKRIRG